jgi:hypothetical protein
MPFARWMEYIVREALKLSHHQGITVVLAHMERYLFLRDKSVWKGLEDSGVFMQMNISSERICIVWFSVTIILMMGVLSVMLVFEQRQDTFPSHGASDHLKIR